MIFKPKDTTHKGATLAARACKKERVAGVLHHIEQPGCLVIEGRDWDEIEKAIADTGYELITKVKEAGDDGEALSK
jgi:hypothetical protein